ncbi:HAMP domain-containing sensor histidine kinase [Rhodanobacter sp. C01]|uniref:HAMP domain-containing sensor histidine kinase n=1 Tax=Rhodanobacter sp. C01 TaxID=1945856 RepID=UPI0009851494|nr:HAMP domain-containing sensor histidine kinase [Rhodanobacter sp. C01]OOG49168.1 two-component sensor histidine kinase [Rhodanobacter sp. C01]
MNPFKSSLYWRLLVWFCVANLSVLFLGGLLTRGFIDYTTAREINWSALAQGADQAYEGGGTAALADWSVQQRQDGIEATLYEKGQPLYPIRLHASIAKSLPDWLGADSDTVLQPWPGIYVAVQKVVGSDGQVRQLVALSRTHARLPPRTRQAIVLGVQLVLSLLFIALLGWWVARSVARPVEALRHATRRMAAGDLSARVGHEGSMATDELAHLALDFDAMAERIEALVTHDRGVLQDLSHELRSPLARLHLILDLAQRSTDANEAETYFRQAEQEIARLDRMTGEMLTLSRLEGGIPGIERERLALVELLQGCIAQAGLEADARQVRLQLMPSQTAFVLGSALLLERALDNLITNAIKFSPAGRSVELAVQVHDGIAELSIRDHGPGVPEAELDSLFRPFFRGSNAALTDGHGLGLAIVQRVVKVHGGEIHARNGEGGGLEVLLRLPLAASVGTA